MRTWESGRALQLHWGRIRRSNCLCTVYVQGYGVSIAWSNGTATASWRPAEARLSARSILSQDTQQRKFQRVCRFLLEQQLPCSCVLCFLASHGRTGTSHHVRRKIPHINGSHERQECRFIFPLTAGKKTRKTRIFFWSRMVRSIAAVENQNEESTK